jgi:FMN-dependent oxidoreductase (nitrilotriacetate monooxygenase family)
MEASGAVRDSNRQMSLILMLDWAGNHGGGWRFSESADSDVISPESIALAQARRAEEGKIDAVFIADALDYKSEYGGGRPSKLHRVEPVTTLAAMAAVTERIGLIGTISTTFTHPYNVARYLGSLDHLSGGRAGWNIVTSFGTVAKNFGVELPAHDDRYLIADEHVRVVTELWDSWADDAIINDRANGAWVREERISPIRFHGQHFDVEGPLNLSRPPQGWPVLVQAGSSSAGIDFAASYAEVVLAVQPTLAGAQAFYSDLKARTQAKGRDPGSVRVLPGVILLLGETESAARSLAADLGDLVDLNVARATLRWMLNDVELDDLDLDKPVPQARLSTPDAVDGQQGRFGLFYRLAVIERRPLRDLLRFAAAGSGHQVIVGTPEQAADQLQLWFANGAADGFVVEPPFVPGGLDAIVNGLIPELQRRGLFRKEYQGSTLREHLGLRRPMGRK